MTRAEMAELAELLGEYGRAKFGDEWWPGNAQEWVGPEKAVRMWELQALADGATPDEAQERAVRALLEARESGWN